MKKKFVFLEKLIKKLSFFFFKKHRLKFFSKNKFIYRPEYNKLNILQTKITKLKHRLHT